MYRVYVSCSSRFPFSPSSSFPANRAVQNLATRDRSEDTDDRANVNSFDLQSAVTAKTDLSGGGHGRRGRRHA